MTQGTSSRRPPVGRGRPRLRYVVAPDVDSRWGVIGSYERLSVLLSEVIRTGDTAVDVGRRAGRQLRFVTTGDGPDPVGQLVDQMARQGFDPVVRQRENTVDVTLRTCPFVTTALADPDTVCHVHLGVAHGIADVVGGLVIDELVAKDPRRARCRLHCHLEPDVLPTSGTR